MTEKILRCQDCCHEFIFTVKQQEHFAAHGWPAPVRCPNCRAAKKQREQLKLSIQQLMKSEDMRKHSRHGRGFFAKLRRW